jgi:outer membrane protein TolC
VVKFQTLIRVGVTLASLAEVVAAQPSGTAPVRELTLAATAEADLIMARQTVRERANALKRLLTDNFEELHDVELMPRDALSVAAIALDYRGSVERALANRADLGQLDLTVSQRELAVRYQRNQRLPQVDLKGSYGPSGSDPASRGVLAHWCDRDYPLADYNVAVSALRPREASSLGIRSIAYEASASRVVCSVPSNLSSL